MFNQKKKTLDELEQIIDDAISGKPIDGVYDEGQVSSILFKLNRYLHMIRLKQQETEQEQGKVKSLISDISHQTKTPIANLLLYSNLLMEHDDIKGELKDYVYEIQNQTEKLNYFVQTLIKSSRLESGIIRLEPKLSHVDALIRDVISQVIVLAENKGIQIHYEASHQKSIFDEKWTSEALHNIVENAIKYTPEGGHIFIDVEAYEMFYRINIKDNGIGIMQEEIGQIFQRFYRSSKVHHIDGLGIGLYLAREIIEQQNGYIKVDSKPNQGSVFSIFFPINSV